MIAPAVCVMGDSETEILGRHDGEYLLSESWARHATQVPKLACANTSLRSFEVHYKHRLGPAQRFNGSKL